MKVFQSISRVLGISRNATSKEIVEAEAQIDEANKRVEETMTELEKLEPTHVVNLLDAMREQTIAYANRNARVIAEKSRQLRRSIIGLVVAVVVIGLLFAGLTATVIRDNTNSARNTAQSTLNGEQVSRFNSSYDVCLQTDQRQKNAVAYIHKILIAQLGKHPTAAAKAAGEKGAREFDALINDLTPFVKNCSKQAHNRTVLP